MGRRSYMVAGRGRALGLALTASLLFMMLGAAGPSAAAAPGPPALLKPSAVGSGQASVADAGSRRRGVLRQRSTTASLDVLVRADGTPAAGVGQRIDLNLFGDANFAMTVGDVARHSGRGHTWTGPLDGVDHGYAALTVRDGALVGQVVTPQVAYRIGYAPDGTQVVQQIDRAAFPREAPPIVPRIPTASPDWKAGAEAPDVAGDTAAQIDVMVIYTPAARAVAGGTLAMQAEVELAIALTNQAYASNLLVQRVRPVFVGEIAIAEQPDIGDDLDLLRGNPMVAWLRDVTRADIVSLITEHTTSPFCGIGYLMVNNSTAFAPAAFNVVEGVCASGNLSFPHELGHNMGAHHDPFVTVGEPPPMFPYSHGYVDTVGKFRTIMAYPDQCTFAKVPGGCPRLLAFSSPLLTFNERPIGTAATSDNARTLSQSANNVANFRQSLVGPPTAFTGVNQSAFSVGDTLSVSVGIENSGRTGVADIYLGLLAPDGAVVSFTDATVTPTSGFAFGNILKTNGTLNHAAFRPIAMGVPLATPFSVNIPGFLSYPWTGGEPRGGYVLFLLVTTANALADGVLAFTELLGASLTPFSFPPAGQADASSE